MDESVIWKIRGAGKFLESSNHLFFLDVSLIKNANVKGKAEKRNFPS
jgi:hypothetical protein